MTASETIALFRVLLILRNLRNLCNLRILISCLVVLLHH
ncbi:MAG: hypothetical protein QOE77_2404 [Blastocatellia bacterium]|nr:hypothetical protein [Blastocatellia bacterium]